MTTALVRSFGGNVQRGVHHIAGKFNRRTLNEFERFERNYGQSVFHFATVGGEASRHAHIALLRHAQGQVAATFEVYVALSVFAEVAVEAGGIADADAQCQVETTFGHGFRHRSFGAVGKADKLYQIVQAVVNRKGRILEHVGHVGAVEHIQLSANTQVARCAFERTHKVGVDLAKHHRLCLFARID